MRRPTFDWRDGSGRTGRAYAAGIAKLLDQGRRLTVQRTDRVKRPTAGERAARVAASQLGVIETGTNTGRQVQVYQASTTETGTGWPWCMAFVRWVWDRAGIHPNGYRGAYVPHLVTWAKKAGKWSQRPVVGAAVVFDWDGGVADHVGIVERVRPDAVSIFIEGNAQPGRGGDQSNGGGVWRRDDRTAPTILGYVHP